MAIFNSLVMTLHLFLIFFQDCRPKIIIIVKCDPEGLSSDNNNMKKRTCKML